MIPKAAIQAFLDRPRKDYRYLKSYTNAQLQAECDRLPVIPPIWGALKKHQKVCFLLGAWFGAFGFLLDTGTGKTLLSIALIRYFRKLGEVHHALVLVPNRINKAEWAREIRKNSPTTSYCVLRGSSKQKWEKFTAGEHTIFIETYAGLMRMVSALVDVKKKRGKKQTRMHRLKPSRRLLNQLLKKIDCLIMDESNAAKRKSSLPHRICRQIVKKAKTRFILSGTPFGRDPTDLWGQMYLIDDGATLGETLTLFREAFFTKKENYWGGMDYTFNKKKKGQLNKFLANRSIRYEANAADLPQLVAIPKHLTLPHDTEVYYERAKEMILAAKGNYNATKNAFLRMRQLSSGFLGYKDDEKGVKAQIEFDENPKLDMLVSLIESIREDRKIIVFHDFIYSGMMIARELKAMGVSFIRLKHNQDDQAELLSRFDHDPDCRVFVLSTAGAYGLNLQVAQYGIFYERPVPVILYKQMRRRFERQGSEHDKVFLYDLIVRNTVDQQIIRFHEEGGDLFRAIVEGHTTPA